MKREWIRKQGTTKVTPIPAEMAQAREAWTGKGTSKDTLLKERKQSTGEKVDNKQVLPFLKRTSFVKGIKEMALILISIQMAIGQKIASTKKLIRKF